MSPDEIRKLASFCDGRTITADAKTGELLRALADVLEAAHRYVHTDIGSLELEQALVRVEAIKP